jgi:hypothetical protein
MQTFAAKYADKCFEHMPYGCRVKKSITIPYNQTAIIGQRLGAPLIKLSNNWLSIHGKSIQINILEAETRRGAIKLHQTLSAMKRSPEFCIRQGNKVIEYVSNDPNLAQKSSYELGFMIKPQQVRYQIKTYIVPINRADYMASNRLFKLFIEADNRQPSEETGAEIKSLASKFSFGNTLILRYTTPKKPTVAYYFTPQLDQRPRVTHADTIIYSFLKPPQVMNIPYIKSTLEVTSFATGWTPTTRTSTETLLLATKFWPVNNRMIRTLAYKITKKQTTPKQKVQAILRWLTPGKNIKFAGTTGSRWGVEKVLQQQYGQCWDFSDCFITLARAAGIPCRQVAGWLYGSGGHVWAEYLIPGKGWQQVDPTGGTKLNCGIYHIAYFSTEDGKMPILYLAMPKIKIINK